MVGYGEEDNHFVMELTYNYGIKKYKKGNDFQVLSLFFQTASLLSISFILFAEHQHLFQACGGTN